MKITSLKEQNNQNQTGSLKLNPYRTQLTQNPKVQQDPQTEKR